MFTHPFVTTRQKLTTNVVVKYPIFCFSSSIFWSFSVLTKVRKDKINIDHFSEV
jgi:hypothetical protein